MAAYVRAAGWPRRCRRLGLPMYLCVSSPFHLFLLAPFIRLQLQLDSLIMKPLQTAFESHFLRVIVAAVTEFAKRVRFWIHVPCHVWFIIRRREWSAVCSVWSQLMRSHINICRVLINVLLPLLLLAA
jgi:hypothetical protein